MSSYHTPYAELPSGTARAASSLGNGEDQYLALGDHLDVLFGDLDWQQLDGAGVLPADLLIVLPMVTVFQYVEDLSDRQAASEVSRRTGWKRMLHLPPDLSVSPSALAWFRNHVGRDTAAQRAFQGILERLTSFGFLAEPITVMAMVSAVDTVDSLERANESMHLALEALASADPDRLRAIALPYWYERYGQGRTADRPPPGREDRRALLEAVQGDVASLLTAIAEAEPALLEWPEVRALEELYRHRFGSGD